MTSQPENPDFTASSSKSFWDLSFPPGFWANMNKSISKTILDETLFSRTTGRMYSTRITFPEFGRAFQQFLRSFKQCSSLQSWSIHCKFKVLRYWRTKNFFFFCRHGCIGAKITAYIIVYFLKIQHQNDKSERENHLWGNVSLSCLQGKLPTIKALVMAWYGVERFHTIVFLWLHTPTYYVSNPYPRIIMWCWSLNFILAFITLMRWLFGLNNKVNLQSSVKRIDRIIKTYLHENGISFWNAFEHISPNMLHTYTMTCFWKS